jgi:hypothetical protein
VQYGCQIQPLVNGIYSGGPSQPNFTEMYSYHPAGAVTAKKVAYFGSYMNPSYQTTWTASGSLEADYTYDSYGRVATLINPANPMTYPDGGTDYSGNPTYSLCTLTFAYDPMGRPSTVGNSPYVAGYYPQYGCAGPWVQNVQYDFAGRQTSAQYMNSQAVLAQQYSYMWYMGESRGYNVNGQLASTSYPNNYIALPQVQYAYSATQNNGQITQEIDTPQYGGTATTTSYQYDAVSRLISATGSGTSSWTQTFQYDGFGNLTQKVLNGTATPIPVNAANNSVF